MHRQARIARKTRCVNSNKRGRLARLDNEFASNTDLSLIVTHPYSQLDLKNSALKGIQKTVEVVQKKKGDIFYLVRGEKTSTEKELHAPSYISGLPEPSAYVISDQGDHNLLFKGRARVLTGGYFNLCLFRSFQWLFENQGDFGKVTNFIFVTDAIYVSKTSNLEEYSKRIGQVEFSQFVSKVLSLKMIPSNVSYKLFINSKLEAERTISSEHEWNFYFAKTADLEAIL